MANTDESNLKSIAYPKLAKMLVEARLKSAPVELQNAIIDAIKIQLAAYSVHDLRRVYSNVAQKADKSSEAMVLKEFIESSGRDYGNSEKIRLEDPIGRKMQRIIFSAVGKKAAIEAQEKGLPPLAGVDSLLQTELGNDYRRDNDGTVQAGYLVTNLMRQLKFEDAGEAPMPANCVARTGKLFRRTKTRAT